MNFRRSFIDECQCIAKASAIRRIGCRFRRSSRPTSCIGRRNGIRVPSSSPRAQMLRPPLGTGPAHVMQFRPVGVEQGLREGAKQPRSPAMDLCFIHVSVLLGSDPLSRSYKLGFCLSAPNICALKPSPLATGRLFRSPEISNVANRYSSAIWMNRARRSVVAALRASSKQLSNCLVRVALIAPQTTSTYRRSSERPAPVCKPQAGANSMRIGCLKATAHSNCSHTEQLFTLGVQTWIGIASSGLNVSGDGRRSVGGRQLAYGRTDRSGVEQTKIAPLELHYSVKTPSASVRPYANRSFARDFNRFHELIRSASFSSSRSSLGGSV